MPFLLGRCGSGGRAVVWQSEGCRFDRHPGRVEVSLSKTPNPQLLLTSWLVPCMAANRRWCVNVCVNGWMRGKNCKALWIKALYKCSPFTIYHSGKRLIGNGFIFQHDNDPKHTANAVKSYLEIKTYLETVMDWPPQSLDLNIIETVWNHLNRERNKIQLKSKEEL